MTYHPSTDGWSLYTRDSANSYDLLSPFLKTWYNLVARQQFFNACTKVEVCLLSKVRSIPVFCFYARARLRMLDRKSTRLNSSHVSISYAVFCLKKKNCDYYMV